MAAATAASAAAARTSASACDSACAILVSASLVRRATNSSSRSLASAACALGLGARALDHRLGFAFGGLLLAPIFGDQRGGLVLQALGLGKVGLDALAPLVERAEHRAVDLEIDQDQEEQYGRERDPEFGFEHAPLESDPFSNDQSLCFLSRAKTA